MAAPPINNQTTNPGMPPQQSSWNQQGQGSNIDNSTMNQMPQPPGGGMPPPPNPNFQANPNQYQPPAGAPGGMGQSPWGVMPPVSPGGDAGGNAFSPGNATWQPQGYGAGTEFGGQGTTGAQAGAADYAGVQGFADQAYDQARRRIDPMQEQAGRRTEQDLVNKGIDPSSAQGMAMMDQQNRDFADQDNSATFGAMKFGQDIQDQMFEQNFANTKQAGDMAQASWANDRNNQNTYGQKYGNELNAGVGWGNIGSNDRRNDQMYNLGQGNLEVDRQGQDFRETVGYDNMDYRNNLFNQNQQNWKDTFTANLAGANMSPYGGGTGGTVTPGGTPVDPYASYWNNQTGG